MSEYRYKFKEIAQLKDAALNHLSTINRTSLSVSSSFLQWKGGARIAHLKQSRLVQSLFFFLRIDYMQHMFSQCYKAEIRKALDDYLAMEERQDKRLCKQLVKDIKACDRLIMAKPYEYFFLNLRNKTVDERKKFVTDKYMLQRMSMIDSRKLHDIELNDKYNFYLLAKPFFKREVIRINQETKYENFESTALRLGKMIFKPSILGCGQGIFVADVSTSDKARMVFSKIRQMGGGEWVAEELIVQDAEMASWNQTSVNTIRLLSFSTPDGIKFTTSFIRTGRHGSLVDNGGSGGIFAAIDAESGIVVTDGKDEMAKSYKMHPDSGMKFKGWQIPRWEELKETAIAIHSIVFPRMKYVGWDFALTKGGWVVIEGNWGQFVHQAALGYGLRPVFDEYIK